MITYTALSVISGVFIGLLIAFFKAHEQDGSINA